LDGPLPKLFKELWYLKKHGRQGWGQFSIYGYIENFENLLLQNYLSDFKIISQEWSLGGPLQKLFKELWYLKKHGRQGRGQFSIYSYIENFENLLLQNYWSDFKIIAQEWSLCEPLQNLFKELWYLKKHGCQGRNQFSIYGYIENFENLLLQNSWSDFKIISQEWSLGVPLHKLF